MILEKDKHALDELKKLIKLRQLVVSEKQMTENNGEPEDMTIDDFEEWLHEIDAELVKIRSKKPYVHWLLDKYLV